MRNAILLLFPHDLKHDILMWNIQSPKNLQILPSASSTPVSLSCHEWRRWFCGFHHLCATWIQGLYCSTGLASSALGHVHQASGRQGNLHRNLVVLEWLNEEQMLLSNGTFPTVDQQRAGGQDYSSICIEASAIGFHNLMAVDFAVWILLHRFWPLPTEGTARVGKGSWFMQGESTVFKH